MGNLYDTQVQENNPNSKMRNPDYGPEIIAALKAAAAANQELFDLLKPINSHDIHYAEQMRIWQSFTGDGSAWMRNVNEQVNRLWIGSINTTPISPSTASAGITDADWANTDAIAKARHEEALAKKKKK